MVKNKQEKTIVALPKKVGHESAASVKKREKKKKKKKKQPYRMIGENPHIFFQEIAHHIWPKKETDIDQNKNWVSFHIASLFLFLAHTRKRVEIVTPF
jgi:hypothetical protein